MQNSVSSNHQLPRTALWVGLLGSPIAWFLHLVLVYTFAEVTCVSGFPGFSALGLHGGVFLILLVTLFTLLLTAAAGLLAHWTGRRLARESRDRQGPVDRGVGTHMVRGGRYLSVLFLFIIAFETIPVLFYLTPCV